MDFRKLTVKELLDNPDTAAVIKELAPQLLKYPIKLLGKKKFDTLLSSLIEKPQGKPTLVPESDKRPAWTINDFQEED